MTSAAVQPPGGGSAFLHPHPHPHHSNSNSHLTTSQSQSQGEESHSTDVSDDSFATDSGELENGNGTHDRGQGVVGGTGSNQLEAEDSGEEEENEEDEEDRLINQGGIGIPIGAVSFFLFFERVFSLGVWENVTRPDMLPWE